MGQGTDRAELGWKQGGKGGERRGEGRRDGAENRGEGRALGYDFMLVRAVHILEKKNTAVASRLTCLNIVYILFLLFTVPNCGSCHQRCVYSGGSA